MVSLFSLVSVEADTDFSAHVWLPRSSSAAVSVATARRISARCSGRAPRSASVATYPATKAGTATVTATQGPKPEIPSLVLSQRNSDANVAGCSGTVVTIKRTRDGKFIHPVVPKYILYLLRAGCELAERRYQSVTQRSERASGGGYAASVWAASYLVITASEILPRALIGRWFSSAQRRMSRFRSLSPRFRARFAVPVAALRGW